MANRLVSIVAPVYNEETVIAELVQRSCDTMDSEQRFGEASVASSSVSEGFTQVYSEP